MRDGANAQWGIKKKERPPFGGFTEKCIGKCVRGQLDAVDAALHPALGEAELEGERCGCAGGTRLDRRK